MRPYDMRVDPDEKDLRRKRALSYLRLQTQASSVLRCRARAGNEKNVEVAATDVKEMERERGTVALIFVAIYFREWHH